MAEAMEIFSNNSVSIEHDLESLIFAMLNLIDTKTKTLKKLIKLHLQIRSLRNLKNTKYKKQEKARDFLPSSDFQVLGDSVDDLTFSEDSQRKRYRSDVSTMSPTSNSFFISNKGNNIKLYEREALLPNEPHVRGKASPSVTDFVSNLLEDTIKNAADTTDDEEDRNVSVTGTVKIDNGVTRVQVYASNSFKLKDSATSTSLKTPEHISLDEEMESIQMEAEDPKEPTIVPPPTYRTRIENEPNQKNKCLHSTLSSSSSYCIISNIQGVLKNLHGCLPGDGGVYMEKSSYKDVVNILENVLISCGICHQTKEDLGSIKVIGMNKSSTQPALKATYEEVPKRMISSTTECNKLGKKKVRNQMM